MTDTEQLHAIRAHARALQSTKRRKVRVIHADWQTAAMRAICSASEGCTAGDLVTRMCSNFGVSKNAVANWLRSQRNQGILKSRRESYSIVWERA